MTARRRQPEQALQRAVVQHLSWRAAAGVWWCHIPNGGLRSKVEAAIFKGLGARRGAPDLLIVADGRAHFLELKSAVGRVTPEQRACHEALRTAGAKVAVTRDIDQAVEALERWRLLRNVSSQTAQQASRQMSQRRAARNSPPQQKDL